MYNNLIFDSEKICLLVVSMGIDDDSKSGLGKLFLPHARILYSADISLCWTGPDQALPPSKYRKDVNVLIDYMLN